MNQKNLRFIELGVPILYSKGIKITMFQLSDFYAVSQYRLNEKHVIVQVLRVSTIAGLGT